MEETTTILSLLFILITIFLLIKTRSPHRNNLPPGPTALPIVGHLHLLKKPLHRSLASLSALHGPVLSLRFGSRRVLLVSSSAAAEQCFAEHDVAFANRPRFLAGKHLGYSYTTVTWASYGPHWRNLRRIGTVEMFSASRVGSYAGIRREEVVAMLKGLVEECTKEVFAEVAIRPRLSDLTTNVMMRMIAGKRYYGKGVKEVEEAKKFMEIVEETFQASGTTNLADFFPYLPISDAKLVKLQKKRDGFMQALVDEHKTNTNDDKTKTIIDVLLSLQENDPAYYTDDIIKGNAMTLLAAGTDTSVVTLEWAMSLLLIHPSTLLKLRAEIDNVVPANQILTESDLPNLPYLRHVIAETLRLHPAAPIIPAHESSADTTVSGYHVPSGTTLLVNAWAIQRDPQTWDRPEEFVPERFEGDGVKLGGGGYLPFGLGRRKCPGEGLAMRVVALALGALVQCFEWRSENVDMMESAVGLVAHRATPLVALCRPRAFLEKALSAES